MTPQMRLKLMRQAKPKTPTFGLVILLAFAFIFSPSAQAANSGDLYERITQAQGKWRESNVAFWGDAVPQNLNPNFAPEMKLQLMLDRLIYVSPLRGYDIRAVLTSDPSVNAYTDGNRIYVNQGLINAFQNNENLIASVMAHELAHIIANHKMAGSQNKLGLLTRVITPLLGFNEYAALGGLALNEMTNLKSSSYSRFQEKEADAIATLLAIEAGFNPYGLSDFFHANPRSGFSVPTRIGIPTNFSNWQSASSALALNVLRASPFYKSHPPSKDRVKIVNTLANLKAGRLSMQHAATESPWLVRVYDVIERRRPKNGFKI